MENMREKVDEAEIFTYACQAHTLNLIAKDLLADKGRANLSDALLDVLAKFRNVHALAAALKRDNLNRPPSEHGALLDLGVVTEGIVMGGVRFLPFAFLPRPTLVGHPGEIVINIIAKNQGSASGAGPPVAPMV